MEIKKLTKEQLNEALKPIIIKEDVTGDKAAVRTASAQDKVEKVKRRIEKRTGVSMPNLDSIFTLEQLAIEPFVMSFNIQVPEPDIKDLELFEPIGFSRVFCRIVDDNPFTIEVKYEPNNFNVIFTELPTETIPGANKKTKKIPAIKANEGYASKGTEGKFYKVQLTKNFLEVAKEISENKNQEEQFNEGDIVEYEKDDGTTGRGKFVKEEGEFIIIETEDGQKIKIPKNKIKNKTKPESNTDSGAGKENPTQLFNDLSGFFKFIVNNNKNLQNKTKNESFIYIEQILKEEEENKPKNQNEGGLYSGVIWVGPIELRTKAKKRREIDISNHQKSVGGGSSNAIKKVNGLKVSDLPSKSGLIKVRDLKPTNNPNLSPEQTNLMKFISNTIKSSSEVGLRKSVSDPKTTFILEYPNKKALVCKVSDFTQDLTKPYFKITIGQKAGGDVLLDGVSINAEISFEFLS